MTTIYRIFSKLGSLALLMLVVMAAVVPAGAQDAPEPKYTLTRAVNPANFGYTPDQPREYEAGTRIYLNADSLYVMNNYGFRFVEWTEGSQTVSKTQYFEYTMPARDVTLTAHYVFDPADPSHPELPVVGAWLSVTADPKGAATFNYDRSHVLPGKELWIYPYPKTGFVFNGWTVDGQPAEPREGSTTLVLTMGDKDVNVVGHFTLDPTLPLNPGANMWNPATGQMIINDFTPGKLYQAINRLLENRGSQAIELTALTVIGKVSGNDAGEASATRLSNLEVLDMSRTNLDKIAYRTFARGSMRVLSLPASVTELAGCVFAECENLSTIKIFATVPPAVASDTFNDFSQLEFCVLRVPPESLALYQEADGWKDFTILPLEEDVRTLTLNLPDDYEEGTYLNYRLELEDIATGIRQQLLVTRRQGYPFPGLPDGAMYNLYLYSTEGTEVARMSNILINGADLDVAFEKIKATFPVYAQVMHGNINRANELTIRWYEDMPDGTRKFIYEGPTLQGVVEGTRLICSAELPQHLGSIYYGLDDVSLTASPTLDYAAFKLTEIPKIILKGKVLNQMGYELKDAIVTMKGLVGGQYPIQDIAVTDYHGQWLLNPVECSDYAVTYSANGHISLTDTVPMRTFQSTIDLGNVKLREITGTQVKYDYTLTSAAVSGEKGETHPGYRDEDNVVFAVKNLTKGCDVEKVQVQALNHKLVLLDDSVEAGDKLSITASSKTGAFEPVTVEATVGDDLLAYATIGIVELGGVLTHFNMTDCPSVRSLLFDAQGNLLKSITDMGATTRFYNLPSGKYTIVTMGDIPLAKGIMRLSMLDNLGFAKGRDYALNEVTVKSGVLTEVTNDIIPAIDNERFNYLGASNIVSVNKKSVTAGQNVTVRCVADFKDSYRDRVKNVKLVFDLPDGLDMVANSLMRGTSLTAYELTPNRVAIPLNDGSYNDQVRFVVTPSTDGVKNLTASFSFDLDGMTLVQPIGTTAVEVDNVAFNTPSTVSTTEFNVSGMAPARSTVKVYDSTGVIGEAKVAANGSWNTNCQLSSDENLKTHFLYAEVTTLDNMVLRSATNPVTYDKNCITLARITMTNAIHSTVVFDYTTGNNQHVSYAHNPFFLPDFNFMIEFSDNDPEKVRDVTLYVYTQDDDSTAIPAEFDEQLGCWVASGKFYMGNLPVNADVDFESVTEVQTDLRALTVNQEMVQNSQAEIANTQNIVLPLIKQMEDLPIDDPDYEEKMSALLKQFYTALGATDMIVEGTEYDPIDEETAAQFKEEMEWIENLQDYSGYVEEFMQSSLYGSFEKDGMRFSVLNLSEANVNYSSWESMSTTQGGMVYYNMDPDSDVMEIVITDLGLYMRRELPGDTARRMRALMFEKGDGAEKLAEWKKFCLETAASFLEKMSDVLNWIDKLADQLTKISHNQMTDRLLNNPEWVKHANKSGIIDRVFYHINVPHSALSYWTRWGLAQSLKVLKYGLPFYSAYQFFQSTAGDIDKLIDLWYAIPDECPGDENGRNLALFDVVGLGGWVYSYTSYQASQMIFSLAALIPSIAVSLPSGGLSIGAEVALFVGQVALALAWEKGYDFAYRKLMQYIRSLQCKVKCQCKKGGKCICPGKCKCRNKKKPDPADPIIDPSGYVYEAVPSNRVPGVQSTIYYKETVEDMYGDLSEQEFVWNAEEYAQRNPLFTDENGLYQWDVPTGLWQVRFKKDGYYDTQSEWLPVPPPQLDVNIPITAKSEPQVLKARAYEEGINIEFDKYMKPATINTDNVFVTLNDVAVPGTVAALNEELSDPYAKDEATSTAPRYATLFRFTPDKSLSVSDGKIRLTVSAAVEDYAGGNMAANFTQEFDIEKEITEIRAAELTQVQRGTDKEVVIDVLPFDASAGKTLNIVNPSPITLGVEAESAVIDENGQARIKVHGNLAGSSVLNLSIDDSWTTGVADIAVVDKLYVVSAPVASRASGTQVFRGTRISLSTDVPEATIYYTLDGSCPCDNDQRLEYWMPIEITGPTTIKAMVITSLGEESETAEFNYTLRDGSIDLALSKGWNWISHNIDGEVAVSDVAAHAAVERILGAEGEAMGNVQSGLSGSLTKLEAGRCYKVKASADVPAVHLEGVALNPAAPIAVASGLNWIGYTPSQKLTLTEALAQSYLESGDCVVGREGFSQYDGQAWEGTLTDLLPGEGYQFYSSSDKHVVFADPAAAYTPKRQAPASPNAGDLKTDTRKYPQVMCLVVNLADDKETLDVDDYALGAFCGDECRGVGRVVGDKYMMSVYGNTGDEIEFVAIPTTEGEATVADEQMKLAEKVVGHVSTPYVLKLKSDSGIEAVSGEGWKLVIDGNSARLCGDTEGVKAMSLHDLEGLKVGTTRNAAAGIAVGHLPSGIYILSIAEEGATTVRKVVIK